MKRKNKKIIQLAIDHITLDRALKLAEETVPSGIDWLEAGTPLIKSEGLEAVRKLREKFPNKTIVADMKIADTGRTEVEIAAKAGANIVDVLGSSSDSTISECIKAAKNYGVKIIVDMIDVKDVVKRAKEAEKLGADYIGIHTSIDEQMKGKTPFEILKKVSKEVNIPISVAGGINSETAAAAIKAGADIIIIGGAISKAKDAALAAKKIREAVDKLKKIDTKLFKRGTEKDLRKLLTNCSTADISDAMHKRGALRGFFPICPGIKLTGPAVTVRTYPGDFAKTVEAIDVAEYGEVIIIDAGGREPVVWGEQASYSAKKKGLAGVVVYGAVRDTADIKKMKFPVFATNIHPAAGEPKGFGEISVPIEINGIKIENGDWIVGDDDGVVIVPQKEAVDIANRAAAWAEREIRERKEIDDGKTYPQVVELKRWEKK